MIKIRYEATLFLQLYFDSRAGDLKQMLIDLLDEIAHLID